jgi:hypothetical protein
MGQTGRRSIATHILAVKIALAEAHFQSFGVARAGPWNTSVNKGVRGRAGTLGPSPNQLSSAFQAKRAHTSISCPSLLSISMTLPCLFRRSVW